MIWRKYIPHAVGLAALILLGLAVQQWWNGRQYKKARDHSNVVAAAAQKFSDSVRIVNTAKQERIDALLASGARSDSQATVWRRRAQASEGALGQLATANNRLSDSLRSIATGADSLPVLVRLVTGLTTENMTLRTSRDDALRADSLRKMAVDSLRAGADSAASRYALLETAHDRVRNALDVSQKALALSSGPCSLLLFRCPSRKTSAVAGVIIGSVAAAAYSRRRT